MGIRMKRAWATVLICCCPTPLRAECGVENERAVSCHHHAQRRGGMGSGQALHGSADGGLQSVPLRAA